MSVAATHARSDISAEARWAFGPHQMMEPLTLKSGSVPGHGSDTIGAMATRVSAYQRMPASTKLSYFVAAKVTNVALNRASGNRTYTVRITPLHYVRII